METELQFVVTVDGEPLVWFSLDYALPDIFVRGFGKDWTLERRTVQKDSVPA